MEYSICKALCFSRISLFNEWPLAHTFDLWPFIYILSIRAALFWKKKFTFHSVFSVLTQKNLPKSIINQMDASGMLLHGCHMMSTLSSHFSNSKHKEHLKSSISWISEFSKFVWPHFSTWKTLTKAEKSSNRVYLMETLTATADFDYKIYCSTFDTFTILNSGFHIQDKQDKSEFYRVFNIQ